MSELVLEAHGVRQRLNCANVIAFASGVVAPRGASTGAVNHLVAGDTIAATSDLCQTRSRAEHRAASNQVIDRPLTSPSGARERKSDEPT